MAKPGRKSAASLSVAATGPLETVKRPSPPPELTAEQAAEWCAVVGRMSADWFPRETQAMLANYCRHVIAGRRIAALVDECLEPPIDVDNLDQLLRMQERESRALSSLATRMRITQQATVHKSKAKPQQGLPPWEPVPA